MKEYDTIVIGAGPSGITAAYLLRKIGFNVLLIDKNKFPREKVCGGALTKKAQELVKRIFKIKPKGIVSNKYAIFYREKRILYGKLKYPIIFVDRKDYDMKLLEKYIDIDGEILFKPVEGIDFNSNKIKTRKGVYKAKYIIAADGVLSKIKLMLPDNLFNKKKWLNKLNIAVETLLENRKCEVPKIHLGYIKYGYGWVFPNNKGSLIGIGTNMKYKNMLLLSLRLFSRDIGIRNLKDLKGWFLPSYIPSQLHYKNTLFVGDAAGFVDPITGEGIYYAHKSGELAANSIIIGMDKKKSAGKIYENITKSLIVNPLKRKYIIRKFLFNLSFLFPKYPIRKIIALLREAIEKEVQFKNTEKDI